MKPFGKWFEPLFLNEMPSYPIFITSSQYYHLEGIWVNPICGMAKNLILLSISHWILLVEKPFGKWFKPLCLNEMLSYPIFITGSPVSWRHCDFLNNHPTFEGFLMLIYKSGTANRSPLDSEGSVLTTRPRKQPPW